MVNQDLGFTQDEKICLRVNNFCRVQAPLHPDRQTFPAVFIQNVQCPERFPVIRPMVHEVIGFRCPAAHAGMCERRTWSRYSGRSRTHDPSFSQSRPLFGCFIGTFIPSRRHRRATRFSLICQPASLRRAAIRRYLYRPYWRVSSIMSDTNRSSSARPTGTRLCEDQCCPRTRQARRSETWNWLRT